jgi:subtilisin
MKNKAIFRSALILFVAGAMLVGTAGTIAVPLGASESPKVDVFVSFDRNPGQAEEELVRAFGGIVKYNYNIVPAIAASVPESSIQGLLNNPRIINIELDGIVYAIDAELDNAWGVKRIGSGTVHDGGNKGKGVKVGIIDSGIDYYHPDLNANFAGGYDFVNKDDDPLDDYGHGTHVAGTVAAEDNDSGVVGVAPEASLYALKVLDSSGGGSWSDVIAAMDWAVTNNLQVVNLSLGSDRNPGGTVQAAFDNAEAAGLVIVAAGGNSGTLAGKGNNVTYPAKYASVIAVAATDSNDQRASWSSTGDEIELAAPGVSVLSTWNDADSPHDPQPYILDGDYYKEGSGTSMASPHVAGSAALVIAAGIGDANKNGFINDEVRQALDNTALDLGNTGRDPLYGFGLVNVAAAVASVAPPVTGTISGRVIDSNTQSSITGATITDGTRSATTDINGVYALTDVPEGTYTVTASAIGYQEASQSVTVTRDSTSTANFSLQAVPQATTVTVNSIAYATSGGKNHDKDLLITVALVDNLSNVVSGASVLIDLYYSGNVIKSGTGTTGSDGTVTFILRNASSGHYVTEVTDVSAAGLTWDGLTPTNEFYK